MKCCQSRTWLTHNTGAGGLKTLCSGDFTHNWRERNTISLIFEKLSLFVSYLLEFESREFHHSKTFETCADCTQKIDINEGSTFPIHTAGGPITDVGMAELRAEIDLHAFTRNLLATGLLSYEYDSRLVLVDSHTRKTDSPGQLGCCGRCRLAANQDMHISAGQNTILWGSVAWKPTYIF